MADVIMPKMGDAMTEGTLLKWNVAEGTQVKSGDLIAVIETDKSNVEVEAEDNGVLRIRVQPGAVVPVGEVIATIGDSAEPVKAAAPAAAPKAAEPAPKASAPTQTAVAAAPKPAAEVSLNGQRVKASPANRAWN